MRVQDIIESLNRVPNERRHLPLVVKGTDEMGNEIVIKVTGAIAMDTDQWGPRIVLK